MLLAIFACLFLVTLGLIMMPSAGGSEMLARQLYGRGGTISAATNAVPTVLTFASPAVAPPAGSLITISGAIGNTNINGTFIVYNVAGATAQIQSMVNGTGAVTPINGNGVLSGTVVWSLAGVENGALKLYSSNTTPAESDTAGTYTELTTAVGYTAGGQALTSVRNATLGWAAPATVGSGGTGNWAQTGGGSFTGSTNVPESTYTTLTWTWTGNATVYGYFVVGKDSTTIWWAERFANPPSNFANGSTLNLTPRFGTTHS